MFAEIFGLCNVIMGVSGPSLPELHLGFRQGEEEGGANATIADSGGSDDCSNISIVLYTIFH